MNRKRVSTGFAKGFVTLISVFIGMTAASYLYAHGLYAQSENQNVPQPLDGASGVVTSNDVNENDSSLAASKRTFTVTQQTINAEKNLQRTSSQFIYEPDLDDSEYTYIIELREPSVLERSDLRAVMRRSFNRDVTRAGAQTSSNRAGRKSMAYKSNADIKQHLAHLKTYQKVFLEDASKSIGNDASSRLVTQYEYVLNGMALRLNQAQAMALAEHPKVRKITRETMYFTNTDRGPSLIGAPQLWQGSVPSLNQSQGEGVVVGIIDSGINTDHPSFAEISGDGYTHTNPLGDGVYLGDCAGQFPQLCNNKLIGVYSYSTITSVYSDTDVFPPNLAANGEDYDGHGSHVAATAAGNVLPNLAETLPTQGETESDGTATGFSFEQISGVAPRANLVSYQVCYPGRTDEDTYANCPGSVINQGIEDAIQDGVDVINFSISGGGDPWRDTTESAFLRAQSIGIFVATSAGNDGAGSSSSDKHSPWYTSVAASHHGRENALVKELGNFSGGLTALSAISGQSNTGSLTADIVYAGDFSNPNDPDNDSAQCFQPFPANTFNGQIVVCDRGEIARVEKAENVRDGGAGGYVLANVQDGETFLANDSYVIPGIHINADDGDRLKLWLASGSNHRATITDAEATQTIVPEDVDVLASFSSRGPNTTISTLTPTMTAPGVRIYAAYADQRFGHDGENSITEAGDFNYLSGTSMSSPHVAGAAALLKSIHPTWTPDHIRSALSLTATTEITQEDGETAADFFDMGAGRIRVDLAAQTGLIMDETQADYLAAEPSLGGEPRSLNLPSIIDNECSIQCTWTRSFTATQDGTWDLSSNAITEGLEVTANPSSFSIQAGQTQEINVTINTLNSSLNQYVFGQLILRADNSPDLQLPISVLSTLGDIPSGVAISASRDNDSLLIEDIQAIDIDSFILTPSNIVKATKLESSISEDSQPSDFLDDTTDGVIITEITVPENALRLRAELVSSSAPDLDIYVLFDQNDDGIPSSFEEIAQSTSFNSNEEIDIQLPDAGRYFLVLQSYSGSTNQPDSFDLRYAVLDSQTSSNLQVEAPSSLSSDSPFDIRFNYELADANIGDDYYAVVQMGRSADELNNLGIIAIDFERGENDVQIVGEGARVSPGDSVSLNVTVAGNTTNEPRQYEITIDSVDGASFTNVGGGTIDSEGLSYSVTKEVGDVNATVLPFEVQIEQTGAPGPIALLLSSELANVSSNTFQQAPAFNGIQVEGAPTINFNGNDTALLNVFEGRELIIPISVIDPNNDSITIAYTQTAGPTTNITQSDGVSSLIAPSTTSTTLLSFDVVADDGNGNTANASFSVNVLNNEPPTINSISAPASVTAGQDVTITVIASDRENDDLVITIGGIVGSSVTLTTPSTVPSVTYSVSVSDGSNIVQDSVVITLNPAPTNESSGGGSSSALYLLLLAMFAGARRAYQKRYAQDVIRKALK